MFAVRCLKSKDNCVRYRPDRGLVFECVSCFYCSLYFQLLSFQKPIQQSKYVLSSSLIYPHFAENKVYVLKVIVLFFARKLNFVSIISKESCGPALKANFCSNRLRKRVEKPNRLHCTEIDDYFCSSETCRHVCIPKRY